jgi:hypothetical protein
VRYIREASFAVALIAFVCVSHARGPKEMPSPQLSAGERHVVTTLLATEAAPNHMMRPLNAENTIVYEQNFGGGGATAGVLFGPLGVAANIAAIKGRTERESQELFSKVPIDVMALASESFAAQGIERGESGDAALALIKPVLSILSVDGTNVQCAAVIFVDHNPAGRKWTGRYVYQLPPTFTRAAFAQGLGEAEIEALKQQIAAGFATLAQLYLADSRGELKHDKQVKFWSDFLSMRFDFQFVGMEIPSEADRLLVRFPLTVTSLVRDQVRWVKKKKEPPAKAG